MSVVLKKGLMKYKDPTSGEYIGINVLSDETTAEQIQAIEAKGEEVIASIPEDYTALVEDVEDLQETVVIATVAETQAMMDEYDGGDA